MDLHSTALSLGGLILSAIIIESGWQRWQSHRRRLRVRLEPVPDSPEPAASASELVSAVRVVPRSGAAMPQDLVPVLDPSPAAIEQQDLFADEVVSMPPVVASAPDIDVVIEPTAAPAQEGLLVDDYIVIHVLPSNTDGWAGEDLLQATRRYGLHFGEMKVFYRHEHPNGQGETLFGMTNAVEPGYFELERMLHQSCLGVSFFQTLPGVQSLAAFDLMLDTARRMAQDLGAQVLDQDYQPLSAQLVEHLRQKVQDYELRRRQQGAKP